MATTHTEASIQVYFTTNYARFNMINGNRQLNELKIKKIIAEIASGNDMLKYYPIQVCENKERLDILDGQHRFWISKQLGRPVFYILVKEGKTMLDVAKINSNVEKWKPKDFINCYVQQGNNDYKIIQEFQDDYGMSLSVTLKLLANGSVSTGGAKEKMADNFREGKFKVKTLSEASEIAETCKQFSLFSNWRSRDFIIAISKVKDAGLVPLEEIIAAFKKRPEMLIQQGNYKGYVTNLEQIVNVGKQKRIIIL